MSAEMAPNDPGRSAARAPTDPPSPQRRTPVRTAVQLARKAATHPESRRELAAAVDRRLKAAPTIRKRLRRLLTDQSSGGGAIPVPPGNLLPTHQAAKLPVTLLVLVGGEPDPEAWAEHIAQAQIESGAFRPLFLVDTDDFAPFRRYGYLFEYVMPYSDWSAIEDPAGWPEYVRTRLRRLKSLYKPSTILSLPARPPVSEQGRASLMAVLSLAAADPVER